MYCTLCQRNRKKAINNAAEPIRASETHCLSFLPPCCACCLFLKQSVPPQQPNLSLTEPCRPPSHALNESSQKIQPFSPSQSSTSHWNNYWPKGTTHFCSIYTSFIIYTASGFVTLGYVDSPQKGKKGALWKQKSNPRWSHFSINLSTKQRCKQIMWLRGTLIRTGIWWIALSTPHL